MSNGNIKTQLSRVPVEWDSLIRDLIRKIEENGYEHEIFSPEIVRLLIHYRPARENLNKAFEAIIKGFQGIKKVSPEVEKWMRGHSALGVKA